MYPLQRIYKKWTKKEEEENISYEASAIQMISFLTEGKLS